MHPRAPDESRLGAAEQRPPSARSRESLVDGLRHEVADARVRLEEAGLRAEAHRLLGNHDGARDATREQQDILADIEARLGRVVSQAVVQRDAEQVLADATDRPDVVPARAPDLHEPRPRTPVLAGAASVLAVAAVAAAAVLGVTGGLDSVEVVGAASDAETPGPTTSSSIPETTPPVRPTAPLAEAPPPATSDDGPTAGDATTATPSDAVAAPQATRPTPLHPSDGQSAVTEESDEDGSALDQAVTELLDAVGGLDRRPDEEPGPDPSASDSETPSIDADMSGQDLGDLVEDVAPDAPGGTQQDAPDGFVPAPSAQ